MRILVTGAAGFIGGHLCEELRDHKVIRHEWSGCALGDLRNKHTAPKLLDLAEPDIVIHLAAQVGRLFGEDDIRHTIDSNAAMTAQVAKACGERGIRMVYASTSEVYGDQGLTPLPAREDDDRYGRVHNMYGLSKLWGEQACELYAPYELTIWRISMPYGPGLPAGRGRAAMINFLYNAHHRLPITVHRDSERSWCWIGDTVRAMRLTLDTDGGVFNIGRDDNPVTMLEVARRACDLVAAPHSLIEVIDPPARQTVVKRLSTDRIRGLGWRPEVDLDEGMWRTLQYVKTLPAPKELLAAA